MHPKTRDAETPKLYEQTGPNKSLANHSGCFHAFADCAVETRRLCVGGPQLFYSPTAQREQKSQSSHPVSALEERHGAVYSVIRAAADTRPSSGAEKSLRSAVGRVVAWPAAQARARTGPERRRPYLPGLRHGVTFRSDVVYKRGKYSFRRRSLVPRRHKLASTGLARNDDCCAEMVSRLAPSRLWHHQEALLPPITSSDGVQSTPAAPIDSAGPNYKAIMNKTSSEALT